MTTPNPAGLGSNARILWAATTEKFELRSDELRVLEDACREVDLIDRMEAEIAGSGLMITGSMGQDRIHPLVSEIRQHRAVLAGLLRALKLPDDGAGVMNQQRSAGQASWAKRGA